MAKRNEIYKSKGKYLKASDLSEPITVTIERAPTETLRNNGEEEAKTVLYFKGKAKCLPLNLTNWDSVCDITGEADSDDWAGHAVQLYATTTELKGRTVDCVRIRAPQQGELKVKAAAKQPLPAERDDMDDEIPF
jgi:hypothetical protein